MKTAYAAKTRADIECVLKLLPTLLRYACPNASNVVVLSLPIWNLGTCVVVVELHRQQRMSKHNDDCLSVAVLPEHSIIIFHIVHHQ